MCVVCCLARNRSHEVTKLQRGGGAPSLPGWLVRSVLQLLAAPLQAPGERRVLVQQLPLPVLLALLLVPLAGAFPPLLL